MPDSQETVAVFQRSHISTLTMLANSRWKNGRLLLCILPARTESKFLVKDILLEYLGFFFTDEIKSHVCSIS